METKAEQKPLSDYQERLIAAFLDGECSIIQRWRAVRLLKNNPLAQEYQEQLKAASRGVVEAMRGGEAQSAGHKPVDLWQRVSARIMQEDRAEIFLGRRRVRVKEGSAWKDSLMAPLGWGMSGAFATALLALLVFRANPVGAPVGDNVAKLSPPSQLEASGSDLSSGISPVSLEQQKGPSPRLGSPAAIEEPVLAGVPQRAPRVFEVDWMKSQGRVKVIPDPAQRAAILWVQRNRPIISQPVESLQAEPILDITPLARGRQPIRMLDDDAPLAFSAFDNR
jgi:hypothetical protein